MSYRPRCVECGADSPHSNTNYTLISRTGWRLIRNQDHDVISMEWRCPICWAKRKARTAHAEPPSGPQTLPPPRRGKES
jgi:hypothetical protein